MEVYSSDCHGLQVGYTGVWVQVEFCSPSINTYPQCGSRVPGRFLCRFSLNGLKMLMPPYPDTACLANQWPSYQLYSTNLLPLSYMGRFPHLVNDIHNLPSQSSLQQTSMSLSIEPLAQGETEVSAWAELGQPLLWCIHTMLRNI